MNMPIYVAFLLLCFFLIPSWVWFKGRKILAVTLAAFALLNGYMIVSYLSSPESVEDAGMVVYGFLFYIPPFVFLVQLLIYAVAKLIGHLKRKSKTTQHVIN